MTGAPILSDNKTYKKRSSASPSKLILIEDRDADPQTSYLYQMMRPTYPIGAAWQSEWTRPIGVGWVCFKMRNQTSSLLWDRRSSFIPPAVDKFIWSPWFRTPSLYCSPYSLMFGDHVRDVAVQQAWQAQVIFDLGRDNSCSNCCTVTILYGHCFSQEESMRSLLVLLVLLLWQRM